MATRQEKGRKLLARRRAIVVKMAKMGAGDTAKLRAALKRVDNQIIALAQNGTK